MASVANGVANGHHPSSSQVQPRKPWSVRFQNLAKAFNDNIVKEVKKDIADLTMSDVSISGRGEREFGVLRVCKASRGAFAQRSVIAGRGSHSATSVLKDTSAPPDLDLKKTSLKGYVLLRE